MKSLVLRWDCLIALATILVGVLGMPPLPAGATAPSPRVVQEDGNSIDQRIAQLLSVTDGTTGWYLKQVGGAILASGNENTPFEPASAIKVLIHLYVMRLAQSGAAQLTAPIPVLSGGSGSASCPQGSTQIDSESLQHALQEMMWHSDNWRALAIRQQFDPNYTNINNMIHTVVGMTNSSLNPNQVLGCPNAYANPDLLTLSDAGRLYEGVANGTLLAGPTRQTFYELMAGREEYEAEGYDWTHLWDTNIPQMIAQEAPAGMTAAQEQAFQSEMRLNYKAGNYKFCTSGNCSTYVDDYAIAGWAELPFCANGSVTPRSYVFGLFINNATSDTNSANAFFSTDAELLREQIQAALASCATTITMSTVATPVQAGWNLITLPVALDSRVYASAILDTIVGATTDNLAALYDLNQGAWGPTLVEVNGRQTGTNFILEPGHGYLLYSANAGSYSMTGAAPAYAQSWDLPAGWALIGLPTGATEQASAALASMLSASGGKLAAIFRLTGNAWSSPLIEQASTPAIGQDFTLQGGQGYLVYSDTAVSVMPSAVTLPGAGRILRTGAGPHRRGWVPPLPRLP